MNHSQIATFSSPIVSPILSSLMSGISMLALAVAWFLALRSCTNNIPTNRTVVPLAARQAYGSCPNYHLVWCGSSAGAFFLGVGGGGGGGLGSCFCYQQTFDCVKVSFFAL